MALLMFVVGFINFLAGMAFCAWFTQRQTRKNEAKDLQRMADQRKRAK